jgi:hypothetical protein
MRKFIMGEWVSIVEGLGVRVLYLPPYSPDFNPIETAFSVIKSWLKRHHDFVTACNDPVYPILIACANPFSKHQYISDFIFKDHNKDAFTKQKVSEVATSLLNSSYCANIDILLQTSRDNMRT